MIPRKIVIHCSDVEAGTLEGIDKYHREHNGWSSVGYHYVIENGRARTTSKTIHVARDGLVRSGRDERANGAHAVGLNGSSLGVCLIGKRKFTANQIASLYTLLVQLCLRWGLNASDVMGHYETPHEQRKLPEKRKTCPNLNMEVIRKKLNLLLGFTRAQLMPNGEQCG